MKISRKLEYALMALRYVASNSENKLISTKEVCQSTGVSFDGVARVLQTLVQGGILESVQGVQGGYRLQKPLDQVSFYSLTKIVLGPIELVKCLNGENICELSPQCNIKQPLRKLDELHTEFYKNVKLSELFTNREQNKVVP